MLLEPTSNAIHAGCVGNVTARISFHGVSGHAARPWLAENALDRAEAERVERADDHQETRTSSAIPISSPTARVASIGDGAVSVTDDGRTVALNDARRFGSLDLVETASLAEWPSLLP